MHTPERDRRARAPVDGSQPQGGTLGLHTQYQPWNGRSVHVGSALDAVHGINDGLAAHQVNGRLQVNPDQSWCTNFTEDTTPRARPTVHEARAYLFSISLRLPLTSQAFGCALGPTTRAIQDDAEDNKTILRAELTWRQAAVFNIILQCIQHDPTGGPAQRMQMSLDEPELDRTLHASCAPVQSPNADGIVPLGDILANLVRTKRTPLASLSSAIIECTCQDVTLRPDPNGPLQLGASNASLARLRTALTSAGRTDCTVATRILRACIARTPGAPQDGRARAPWESLRGAVRAAAACESQGTAHERGALCNLLIKFESIPTDPEGAEATDFTAFACDTKGYSPATQAALDRWTKTINALGRGRRTTARRNTSRRNRNRPLHVAPTAHLWDAFGHRDDQKRPPHCLLTNPPIAPQSPIVVLSSRSLSPYDPLSELTYDEEEEDPDGTTGAVNGATRRPRTISRTSQARLPSAPPPRRRRQASAPTPSPEVTSVPPTLAPPATYRP